MLTKIVVVIAPPASGDHAIEPLLLNLDIETGVVAFSACGPIIQFLLFFFCAVSDARIGRRPPSSQ